ncbi:MAG: hypothetical protein AAF557_02985 [Pseudomonadota bacterium]
MVNKNQSPSILIAQPTTGTVVSQTVGFLAGLFRTLSDRGIHWGYSALELSDIAFSRNIFASNVIADNEFTHLLFIDSDMGFLPETILGLLEFNKPVTAVACPKRHLPWDHLIRLAAAEIGKPKDQRHTTKSLVDVALDYNVYNKNFDGSDWVAERDGNFIKVPAVGTGVMLIHRDVFEIMLAKDVARPRTGHKAPGLLIEGAPYCDFFSQMPTPDGSLIESEDISFCKRWVEDCGGEIWVDIDSRILHYGMRGHGGRYMPRAMDDFPEIDQ